MNSNNGTSVYKPEDLAWIQPPEKTSEKNREIFEEAVETAKRDLVAFLREKLATTVEMKDVTLEPKVSFDDHNAFRPTFRQRIGDTSRYWQVKIRKTNGQVDLSKPIGVIEYTDIYREIN